MDSNVTVRFCVPKDETVYVRMNLEFMQEVRQEHTYWERLPLPTEAELGATFREALAADGAIRMFIAEYDGEPAGFANTWTVYSIWSRGRALIIDDLFVRPACRSRGVGRALMEQLEEYARRNGCRRLQLHAETDNENAQSFYWQLGFEAEDMAFFLKNLTNKGQ